MTRHPVQKGAKSKLPATVVYPVYDFPAGRDIQLQASERVELAKFK